MNLILLISLFVLSTCIMRGNETDRLALLEFKSLIREDPSAVLTSWNSTNHFCQWHGVTCSPMHQRVTVLDLESLKLVGSISPHVGNLSFLRDLNLLDNEFDGKIPPEIGSLKRLQSLRLYNNSLSGTIPPSLSNCSDLTLISLGNNQLVGQIPVELASLKKLQLLAIQWNYLTGQIPNSIGNVSSLTSLAAARNSLHGSIPESIGRLKNFQSLEVGANNLSGTIPPPIFNLTSLTTLDLTENYEIRGHLPLDLFNMLPNLEYVSFASNQFSGSIPVSISNASNLMMFQAQANQFSGAVPSMAKLHKLQRLLIWGNLLGTGEADDIDFLSSLVNATGLEMVIMDNNDFGGVLPDTIGNLSTSLAYLTLGSNRITGEIPPGIGNLVNMVFLSMQINRISGRIPSSIGQFQGLVRLYLDRNQLTGNIPSSIGNLTLLTDLSLGSNFFQGEIPPSLGTLQAVAFIDVGENNLTGPIPTELFGLSSLSMVLDLSRNNFVGGLPREVGNLSNLGALDVSENALSGEIPVALGTCVSLEQLYMQGNKFQGSIPLSLSSLKVLHRLDLSRNNLSGEIPSFLEKLNLLQVLNLSSNNFEGPVPASGVFKNASAISLVGNDELCGGSTVLHLPRCIVKEPKKPKSNLTRKLVISIVSVLTGASLLALFFVLCLFRRKRRDTSPSSSFDKSLIATSYHSLLKATEGFSGASLLGVGAFGSVYKGTIIDGDKTTNIAVKVLNLSKRGATKSFLAECEALRNIRHRNLVKVLTVCSGIDGCGNDFKAIVYEFMVNGSLEDWLHQTDHEGAHGTQRIPSILQRLNVAIDVACALDYLHNHCETSIVHCDLKPSNILLDAEMVAHVGDFGLARFIPEAIDEPRTNQSSTVGIRGTTGYVAPGKLVFLSTYALHQKNK